MPLSRVFRNARNPPADPVHLWYKGKTVLVTGANMGLGYQAAPKYAAVGAAPLILGVCSLEKGETAKASIVHETGCDPMNIQIITVNMSMFASVRDFLNRLSAQVHRLHVVLLALMALLLLPKLRDTAAAAEGHEDEMPRLCLISSQSAYMFDNATQNFLLKLAAWYAVKGLVTTQGNTDGAAVIINACCPRMCRTDLGRDFPLGQKVFMADFQAAGRR